VKILGIETSCDETACAIVEDGIKEIASAVASSADLHEKTGGVVPEVAARKQVESITPVIEACLHQAGIKNPKTDIDAIAVTVGPGLIGSLLVGVEAAKALSLVWDKPLIPVNHLIGHIYGNFVQEQAVVKIPFPAVVLIVSGGHTDLVIMYDHGKFEYLGGTLDDAAGEAFDKVARLLGLSKYLGGAMLSGKAAKCTENTLMGRLPRPMMDREDFDFSFSGLKTAVLRLVEKEKHPVEAVACEFEQAATEVLIDKTIKAAKKVKAASILLGGGVAANQKLRTGLKYAAEEIGIPVFVPPLKYCGDSAVYVASAAHFNNFPQSLIEITANPSLTILDL
jgi:N6-L-threonylcarbamoyladenine synthase